LRPLGAWTRRCGGCEDWLWLRKEMADGAHGQGDDGGESRTVGVAGREVGGCVWGGVCVGACACNRAYSGRTREVAHAAYVKLRVRVRVWSWLLLLSRHEASSVIPVMPCGGQVVGAWCLALGAGVGRAVRPCARA